MAHDLSQDTSTLARLQENLSVAEERLLLVQEQRTLCASMLAHHICQDEGSLTELFDRFLHTVKDANEVTKACFCQAYIQRHQKEKSISPEVLLGMNETPSAGSHGKIALVRNRYNERAYECFENLVIGAKPYYASDFAEACDSVYNGQCSYCILPLENSANGRLFGFYSLMDRYDLKICSIAEMDGSNASETVRYALVGRSLPRGIAKASAYALEFSLTRADGGQMSDLLSAASILGATLERVDFLPLEYDHSFYRAFFTMRLSAANASAFALYLTLCHQNHTPLGFYTI